MAGGVGAILQLVEQAGLADARLAADRDRGAAAGVEALERVGQCRELLAPSDDPSRLCGLGGDHGAWRDSNRLPACAVGWGQLPCRTW
jgi:hypothetical protein